MNTIGPEPLVGTGTVQGPAGAAQTEPGKTEGAAPTGPGQGQTPTPEQAAAFAELSRKLKSAEDERDRAIGLLQTAYTTSTQQAQTGTQTGYTPAPASVYPEWVTTWAAQTGATPEQIDAYLAQRTGQTVAQAVTPLYASQAEGIRQGADWQIIEPEYRKVESELLQMMGHTPGSAYYETARNHPQFTKVVLDMAKGRSREKYAESVVEQRIAQRSGKVVGQFTEGAAPGSGGQGAPALAPEVQEWAKGAFSAVGLKPEDVQKNLTDLAARRAARGE